MSTTDRQTVRARRYLLSQASEEECAAIEQEYFGDEDAVDAVAAAEEDLIEDYLARRLGPDERDRFEREYLAAPHHRRRVETIRRLMEASSQSAPEVAAHDSAGASLPRVAWNRRLLWPVLAAASLLLAVGTVWMLGPSRDGHQAVVESRPPAVSTPSAPPPAPNPSIGAPAAVPRVFALSISPVAVRGADESPVLIIPAGTDLVALRLEGEGDRTSLGRARASVRTVTGDEVWDGPATVPADLPAGAIAQIGVPVERLHVDDYVVELFGTDQTGIERERYRYFLRVRAR